MAGEGHTRRASIPTFLLFLPFAFRLLPIARLQLDHSDLPVQYSRFQKRTGTFSAFSVVSRVGLQMKTMKVVS